MHIGVLYIVKKGHCFLHELRENDICQISSAMACRMVLEILGSREGAWPEGAAVGSREELPCRETYSCHTWLSNYKTVESYSFNLE